MAKQEWSVDLRAWKISFRLAAWAGLLWGCTPAPLASQTWGRVLGQVRDISQRSVPDATVTAEDPSTGLRRQAVTSGSGYYSITELPIGTYAVEAMREGFQSVMQRDVWVGVGQSVRVDFTLTPRGVTSTVEVKGNASGDGPEGSRPGMAVGQQPLANLPINGRDYARLSLLAPGALSRSNQIADLSFNGMHSVHNQFAIDGIDATRLDQPYVVNGAERGARLLTGSLDSIAEFRVETGNYPPEYGRAASAYINIATKSGTNRLHAAVFEYMRNNWLDARNFFNTKPSPQAAFRYHDFGGSVSGPIRRNSTFFFANYEGSRQHIGVIGSGTVPSATLRSEVLQVSPALAPILAEMPYGTAPTGDGRVDTYTTTQSVAIREDTGSVKINRSFGERNAGYLRTNVNTSRVEGPLFATQASALGLLDHQDVPIRTVNVALGDQHVFSSRLINDFLAGLQRVQTLIDTGLPQEPLVMVTGLTIAPGSRGRTVAANTSYQIGDRMSLATGANTLKWGITGRNVRLVQRSTDVAILTYTSLADFISNRATAATLAAGNPGSATWGYELGAWAQDTWQARPTLTLDYGVRYDYFAPPFDPQNRARPYDPRTGSLAPPGAAYFQSNKLNFAPRFGVAWQARPRLVLRWGYGLFYDAYPVGFGAIPGNTLPGNTTLRVQQIPSLSYPLTPFLGLGVVAKPSVTGFDWNKPDLYSHQWSATVDWQITSDDTARAAYIGNRGLHLRRNMNANLIDPVTGQPPNPNFSSINLETATGNSYYNALQLTWTRQFQAQLSGAIHYIWAHSIDDVPDPAVVGSAQPQDNRDFRAERGNGSGDVCHRLSYSLLYELPKRRGKLWSGWKLATVGHLRTGVAQSVLIGTNTSGDGNLVNQRPSAVADVDPYARQKTVDHWFNAAAFQLPARGSFGNLGRNTVFGPGLVQLDASLLKDTQLDEAITAQFRVEVFNALNHPNFSQPNNVFGTAAFGRIFSTLGNTIGMGTARQIQLAIRFTF